VKKVCFQKNLGMQKEETDEVLPKLNVLKNLLNSF